MGYTVCLLLTGSRRHYGNQSLTSLCFRHSVVCRWELIVGKLNGKAVVAVVDSKAASSATTGAPETFFRLQFIVRLFKVLGAQSIIIIAPAVTLISPAKPASVAIFKDHVNMTGSNPLFGHNEDRWGARFPDMNGVYTAEWRAAVKAVADAGIRLD